MLIPAMASEYQAAAVADPTKNLGGSRSRVAIHICIGHSSHAVFRKFRQVLFCYRGLLRLRAYTRRYQLYQHCAGSPHQSVGKYVSRSISNFRSNFEHFPIVRFGWHFLHRFILGFPLQRLHFFLEITSLEFPPNLFPYFWILSHCLISIKNT